jgi:hypothetical protein
MPRLLTWPVIFMVVVTAQLPELWWLLRHGWLVQTFGATLLGGLIGRQLRAAVRRIPWLVLAITLGVSVTLQFIPDGEANRLVDQCYVALLVAALWPEQPGRRYRQAIEAAKKTVRRWSTGIPLPG